MKLAFNKALGALCCANAKTKANQKFNINTPPNAENGLICISECANKTLARS
jgi:hypothetical protein